jgi:hypothetical protein
VVAEQGDERAETVDEAKASLEKRQRDALDSCFSFRYVLLKKEKEKKSRRVPWYSVLPYLADKANNF